MMKAVIRPDEEEEEEAERWKGAFLNVKLLK